MCQSVQQSLQSTRSIQFGRRGIGQAERTVKATITIGAIHEWHCFILPEVEMSPAPLAADVDAALPAAAGTGKLFGALEEIHREGELFGLAFVGDGSEE
jgi:hypothetical protein